MTSAIRAPNSTSPPKLVMAIGSGWKFARSSVMVISARAGVSTAGTRVIAAISGSARRAIRVFIIGLFLARAGKDMTVRGALVMYEADGKPMPAQEFDRIENDIPFLPVGIEGLETLGNAEGRTAPHGPERAVGYRAEGRLAGCVRQRRRRPERAVRIEAHAHDRLHLRIGARGRRPALGQLLANDAAEDIGIGGRKPGGVAGARAERGGAVHLLPRRGGVLGLVLALEQLADVVRVELAVRLLRPRGRRLLLRLGVLDELGEVLALRLGLGLGLLGLRLALGRLLGDLGPLRRLRRGLRPG